MKTHAAGAESQNKIGRGGGAKHEPIQMQHSSGSTRPVKLTWKQHLDRLKRKTEIAIVCKEIQVLLFEFVWKNISLKQRKKPDHF